MAKHNLPCLILLSALVVMATTYADVRRYN